MAVLGVGLVLVAIARAYEGRLAEERIVKTRALELAVSAARSLDATIDESHILLATLAELLPDPSDSLGNAVKLATMYVKTPMRFTNIWMLDTLGLTTATALPTQASSEGVTFAGRPYFREAMRTKSFTVGQAYRSRTVPGAPWVLVFAMPMLAPPTARDSGRVRSILLASVHVDSLEAVKVARSLPDSSVLTVLDTTATVLIRSLDPDHWVGRKFEVNSSVRDDLPFEESVTLGKSMDGLTRLVGFHRTKSAPWTVFVGIPSKYTLDEARRQFVQDLVVAALIIGVLLWIGNRIIGRVVGPIESLTAAAVAYADGDLSRRTTVETNDEVGQLAVAFNRLADTVVDRNAALAQSLEQLSHSQKMDALGAFAGGIAHDFNNYLTAIIAYSELALADLPKEQRARTGIEEVIKSAESATQLTRQILVFSRKQVVQPQLVEMSELVNGISTLIDRMLGDTIRLSLQIAPPPSVVLIDRSQFEQVIVNLAANARDAMPDGGQFRLSTTVVSLDREEAALVGIQDGEWVLVTASDNGVGIAPEVRSRVFEPFYTTKDRGRGTGLGLTLAYGLMQQAGGTIRIESAVGHGTTVSIYLPSTREQPATVEVVAPSPTQQVQRARVLLVEDDAAVRAATARILTSVGHQVASFADGEAALQALSGLGEIDLLLTDVVMPGMSGPRVAREVLRRRPNIGVLFMSGFPGDELLLDGMSISETPYLPKPFHNAELLDAVSRALNSRPATPERAE